MQPMYLRSFSLPDDPLLDVCSHVQDDCDLIPIVTPTKRLALFVNIF